MSIASNPSAAIRSTACSMGRELKLIDEHESRIFQGDLDSTFSAAAAIADPPINPTAAAALDPRKARRLWTADEISHNGTSRE